MTTPKRSQSIDMLRGLAMIFMALDHSRDFFTSSGLNPVDLSQVSVPIFLTRWVTHFCAPVFVFLAGVGAALSLGRGRKPGELSVFLFKRGVWIIFLELTVVRLGWMFDLNYALTELQVFWAIGWAMLFLAATMRLRVEAIGIAGLLIVGLHNCFDRVGVADWGAWGWVWQILHVPGELVSGRYSVRVIYPIVPWLGVISLGFWFGTFWKGNPQRRVVFALRAGGAGLLTFLILRATNLYGDLDRWVSYPSAFGNFLSFINVQKYPPSLDFLCVTLGPALLVLSFLERKHFRHLEWLSTFGSVSLFYYMAHIFVIHAVAIGIAYGTVGHLESWDIPNRPPIGYGLPLWSVYGIWLAIVGLLYPACRWFSQVKKRSKHPLLSYL